MSATLNPALGKHEISPEQETSRNRALRSKNKQRIGQTEGKTMIIDEQGRLDASNYTKYEVDGVNLSVFEAGDRANPTLVMFHGAPHNTQEFRFNIPALLDAGFHIVAADHLGAGDSDRPMEVDLYSGEKDYERAIALMDKMGLDQFYIDCGDRGSLPGWMIATRHPERVLGIISENVTHLNGFFTSGITQKRHSWYMWYFQFDVAKEALAADDWALARAFFDYHPDFQEFILQDWLRPNGLEASWLNWYRSTVHPDKHTFATLPNLKCPALILYTMNDPYIASEQLAPGNMYCDGPLEMKLIDGAGHFIARNAPERFNAAVIDFIERQEKIRTSQ
ncbi:hypothetical protein A3711_07285 [Erythrobacter sp. HI00D59]|nr:hypothetical protein A3711_07285 [Erythrobacter sp. HI00D59]